LGEERLTQLSLHDDLDPVFGAFRYMVTQGPTYVDGNGTFTPNSVFNGSSQTQLLLDGYLNPGEWLELSLWVEITEVSDLGLGFGVYSNQVLLQAESLLGEPVEDFSDAGSVVDANLNGFAGDPGEDDPTIFDIFERPQLGCSKLAEVSGQQVSFSLRLINMGNSVLHDVQWFDLLEDTFGSGTYGVTDVSFEGDAGGLVLDPAFQGTATQRRLAYGTLELGADVTLNLTVYVTELSDQGFGFGVYQNQAYAEGFGPSGGFTMDLSNHQTTPDSNGNGDPSDPADQQPTVFSLIGQPALALAQSAHVQGVEITLDVRFGNIGTEPLLTLELRESLDLVFGQDHYGVVSLEWLEVGEGCLLNTAFDGHQDTLLMSAASLMPRTQGAFRLRLRHKMQGNQGFGYGLYAATVSGTGITAQGQEVTDISDDGTVLDANGNGVGNETGENDPTWVEVPDFPSLGLALQANASSGFLQLDMAVANLGNVALLGTSIPLDLFTLFTPHLYEMVMPLTVVEGNQTLWAHEGYDGHLSTELLSQGLILETQEQFRLRMGLAFTGGSGGGLLDVLSQIHGTAQSSEGVVVQDDSDWGLIPDANGNGVANDEGEDDPTPIRIEIQCDAPTLMSQPHGAMVCPGEDVSLAVQAQSSLPVDYQWFFDDTPVPGETNASLWLQAVSLDLSGLYYVVVSNTCGETLSAPAEVLVTPLNVQWTRRVLVQGVAPLAAGFTFKCPVSAPQWTWFLEASGISFWANQNPVTLPLLVPETESLLLDLSSEGLMHYSRATILVAQHPQFLDWNGDGCNTLSDLHGLLPLWRQNQAPDGDGDGHMTVLDYLFLNLFGDCL
jgi:hypothetical protein